MQTKSKLAFWMGWRYLFAGAKGYSSFVNWVSVIGLALGVMLFIVISSVHNGLNELTRDRLLNSIPHAVLPSESVSNSLLEQLEAHPRVLDVVDYFEELVLVQLPSRSDAVLLSGHEGRASQDLADALVRGNHEDLSEGIVLSSQIASSIELGESVLIVLISLQSGNIQPRFLRLPLVGTFSFKSQADFTTAFISVNQLRELGVFDPSRHGKRIYISDPANLKEIEQAFPDLVTWNQTYEELFRAYQLEKIVLYCLMFLVVILASFNVVSGQAMMVNTKRADIAIMTTMGAPHSLMVKVLAYQGLLVSFFGVVLGTLLGIVMANYIDVLFDLFDEALNIPLLEGTGFSSMPSKVKPLDVVIGVFVALLLSVVAVVQPVWRLIQLDPVEELN